MRTPSSTTPDQIAGWLSPHEFATLEAICDTFFPTLQSPPQASEMVADYYRRNAHDVQVARHIAEALAQENSETQTRFRQLLTLMERPATGLLLVGHARPFRTLASEQRERYLLAMANSPLGQLRQGYQALKRLSGFIYFSVPDAQGQNPNWPALDYTAPSPPPVDVLSPIQPLVITKDTVLEADAIVIGSGAGGGVVAAELAQAGKHVIVLEQGGYQHDATFTLQEAQAMPELYLKRGLLTSNDAGVIILAGGTLGGGTTVNWTTSLRADPAILAEWDQRSGLPGHFTGPALQASYAAVEQRIGVNTDNSAHNRQNQLLVDGCIALGYHAGPLPRNAVGCEQRCGTCGFGCRYGCKQSTTKTYLQDAYNYGARIIVHCRANSVALENGRVTGVDACVTSPDTGKTYRLTIHAKTVVVAAGAINSPAILLRSGLEHPHLGRHLFLHPTSTIAGIYREPVHCWQGVMQSAYSDQFGWLDGNYGYKLEVPPVHPGLLALGAPWYSAREYREQMLLAAHTAISIVLTRDRGSGSITLDRDGEPVVQYVTSVYDRKHLLHGLRQAARVQLAAGALAVSSLHSKRTQLMREDTQSVPTRDLHAFERRLERHGMGPNRLIVFSAHQMGTCRMGADPRLSVTDEHGAVHGVKGLFVCDGSLFPSSSGVNPMLTIMALAYLNSQYIKTVV